MATKSTRSSPRPKKAASARSTRAVAKAAAKRPATKRKPRLSVEAASPSPSKQAQLIALLQSPTGGTLEQMTSLTGWQPHSVRGVISGVLRKRLGLDVSSEVHDGSRVYRIGAAA
jgi:hypothetical protein